LTSAALQIFNDTKNAYRLNNQAKIDNVRSAIHSS